MKQGQDSFSGSMHSERAISMGISNRIVFLASSISNLSQQRNSVEGTRLGRNEVMPGITKNIIVRLDKSESDPN